LFIIKTYCAKTYDILRIRTSVTNIPLYILQYNSYILILEKQKIAAERVEQLYFECQDASI